MRFQALHTEPRPHLCQRCACHGPMCLHTNAQGDREGCQPFAGQGSTQHGSRKVRMQPAKSSNKPLPSHWLYSAVPYAGSDFVTELYALRRSGRNSTFSADARGVDRTCPTCCANIQNRLVEQNSVPRQRAAMLQCHACTVALPVCVWLRPCAHRFQPPAMLPVRSLWLRVLPVSAWHKALERCEQWHDNQVEACAAAGMQAARQRQLLMRHCFRLLRNTGVIAVRHVPGHPEFTVHAPTTHTPICLASREGWARPVSACCRAARCARATRSGSVAPPGPASSQAQCSPCVHPQLAIAPISLAAHLPLPCHISGNLRTGHTCTQ